MRAEQDDGVQGFEVDSMKEALLPFLEAGQFLCGFALKGRQCHACQRQHRKPQTDLAAVAGLGQIDFGLFLPSDFKRTKGRYSNTKSIPCKFDITILRFEDLSFSTVSIMMDNNVTFVLTVFIQSLRIRKTKNTSFGQLKFITVPPYQAHIIYDRVMLISIQLIIPKTKNRRRIHRNTVRKNQGWHLNRRKRI